jgi:quercetin dioxygenase-like cupin family protein
VTEDIHADRREPEHPEGAFDLRAGAEQLLGQAHEVAAGRAARSLTPGAGALLTQTLLALRGGERLDEHQAPSPATLQVLTGEVVLVAGGSERTVAEHHWATIPTELHELRATTDAVVLLTVAVTTAPRA